MIRSWGRQGGPTAMGIWADMLAVLCVGVGICDGFQIYLVKMRKTGSLYDKVMDTLMMLYQWARPSSTSSHWYD
jgi:hypothetical protein